MPEAFTPKQLRNIQGFGIAGFRKDHQEAIFIRFGDQAGAKRLMTWLKPRVANAWEVSTFNTLFSEVRKRTGRELLKATWVAVMLTAAGLEELNTPPAGWSAGELVQPFIDGMAARSTQLGDTQPADQPSGWKEPFRQRGGIHLVVVVASDDEDDLGAVVLDVVNQISSCGADVVYQERADTLPGDLAGHGHFGFRDGVSQPAIDGWDAAPGSDEPPAVPPGEFVFGYPNAHGEPIASQTLADSSMVAFRRLKQDVPAFRALAAAGIPGSNPTVTAEQLAAKMIGRWPSGAPLEANPDTDPGPGDSVPNDFVYGTDPDGQRCPRWAHIRKANPRDEKTPDSTTDDPKQHRMLRRGIPFGPPAAEGTTDDGQDRGMHFFAVVTDLARQFEFVQRQWLNDANFPGGEPGPTPGAYGPPAQGLPDGPDPVVGEHNGSAQAVLQQPSGAHPFPLAGRPVTVTAGEYFWMPSLRAIDGLCG